LKNRSNQDDSLETERFHASSESGHPSDLPCKEGFSPLNSNEMRHFFQYIPYISDFTVDFQKIEMLESDANNPMLRLGYSDCPALDDCPHQIRVPNECC
jgi:hypothetical protein